MLVQSGDTGSLLDKLNADERGALAEWSASERNKWGTVDLMRWPGWSEALQRMQFDMEATWAKAIDIIDRVKSRGNG
ncbi:hypothetical protein [Pandoraea sp. ISTKB]|uniref:hypothetical protein n=1 Tax=Pandoraea sp. ISTKB TaxID=1586708 RepID=UPI001112F133|nr:hypothetical protein [Pandoraea sp. ISTKB]